MNRVTIPMLALLATALSACGNGSVDESAATATSGAEASLKPGAQEARTSKPQAPVTIDYNIIGTPIVGQPVGIDVQVTSTLGPQPITLSYRVNDSTAMQLPEDQAPSVAMLTSGDAEPSVQQVRVVPMREGRLFLNVSATVETEGGRMSTVTAIPIQVGAAPREIIENGEVVTDENGELLRSLPASDD